MNIESNFKIKQASFYAILVSTILCVLKFLAYHKTGSCSLHASAMDSLMDIALSFVNLIAVYIISIKKSNWAPNGWDKLASIVVLIQSLVISFLAFEIMKESLERFYSPAEEFDNFEYILIIACVSFFLSLMLVLFQRKVVKETNSLVIKADMVHFISDLYSNALIFVGFIVIKCFNLMWLDAALGIFVSFYLIFAIIELVKMAIISLLDLNMVADQKVIFDAMQLQNMDISLEDILVLCSGARKNIVIYLSSSKMQNVKLYEEVIFKSLNHLCGDQYSCQHCPKNNQLHGNNSIQFVLKVD